MHIYKYKKFINDVLAHGHIVLDNSTLTAQFSLLPLLQSGEYLDNIGQICTVLKLANKNWPDLQQ